MIKLVKLVFFVIFERIMLAFQKQELSMMIRNVMTRLPEVYEELRLLMNILSIRIDDVPVVRFGLAMCGRRRNEYIESRKFEMSLFVRYFSRSTLKSPS